MPSVLAIAAVTLREASRRRLLLAGISIAIAFVAVFTIGFYLIFSTAPCGPAAKPCESAWQTAQIRIAINMMAVAGLYVANFLTVITAVLLPVDTLSGEISSGVAQTMASKPVRRAEIVLGKWLAYWLLAAIYVLLTGGGIVVSVWAVTGYVSGQPGFLIPGVARCLGLMLLAATVMLTVSIAGGTRFSTITNGMVAFGLFGLAFLGGWLEQIGVLVVEGQTGRSLVRNIGTVISLAMPADALWRLAAYAALPSIIQKIPATPFTSMYPPTDAMIAWAAAYVVVVLVVAVRQFERRAL